ncbi:hypothetical protein SDC9_74445 [bioreactor metagenome]|uniref:Uncharacterized protein n=1 Tax=bioreactor metagenome TaxID=1076179 RepID=A0A644YHX2_9ZZZZ
MARKIKRKNGLAGLSDQEIINLVISTLDKVGIKYENTPGDFNFTPLSPEDYEDYDFFPAGESSNGYLFPSLDREGYDDYRISVSISNFVSYAQNYNSLFMEICKQASFPISEREILLHAGAELSCDEELHKPLSATAA